MAEYKLSENSSLALDALRAFASQAVVVGHGISFFGIWQSLQPPKFLYIQNLAVVVFFVLSGFLITYATLRKSTGYRFREFFIDRFARIYSAYGVVLVLVWLIDRFAIYLDPAAYGYYDSLNWRTFVGNTFMLQDFPRGEVHSLLLLGHDDAQRVITSLGSARPFWTLAIEWWIYMGFGWIVLRRARSVVFFVLLAPLCVPRLGEVRTRTLFGGALAFGGLSMLLLYSTKEPYDPKYSALFAAAMLCGVLALDRVQRPPPPWLAAAIRFVANYSFTLYLLHYTILALIATHPIVDSPLGNFALAFVITNVASIIVAYFTEFRHRALAAWLKTKLISSP